jgi:hypothetical protein
MSSKFAGRMRSKVTKRLAMTSGPGLGLGPSVKVADARQIKSEEKNRALRVPLPSSCGFYPLYGGSWDACGEAGDLGL